MWQGGIHDDDHEETLMKIESAAIRPIRKLARRETLDDTERWDVAEYVIASLFRNSAMIDRAIAESIEEIKERLPSELSVQYPGIPEAYAREPLRQTPTTRVSSADPRRWSQAVENLS